MLAGKIRVGVLFGGRSGEHAVSLLSAASVMAAMDKNKYDIIPIGITEDGQWLAGGDPLQALRKKEFPRGCFLASLVTNPLDPGLFLFKDGKVVDFISLDVVFPVLHGPYGEDGTVQGLLELAGIPYVGAGVLASSAGMDKEVMKILFQRCGLPVADFIAFKDYRWRKERSSIIELVEKKIGYPCFIKPANLGSSVGVSKASGQDGLIAGIELALRYDRKAIVEVFIDGREIECSVLGGDDPISSVPGEIIPSSDFYDYRAKYIDNRSQLIIPAPLDAEAQEKIRRYAIQAFQAVDCSGLGRVDFFYREKGKEIYVSEINTMPGFTEISMYPRLWEYSGVPYGELIDKLVEIALERQRQKSRLLTRYKA
ncbi:MAG: D-alanine--D-alanine ligase [Firmicutes bacterium]|nr:D-alanine--D-alanine ligase [Bacillota bacterium]